MHWIVFDYGEVISRRPTAFGRLAALAGPAAAADVAAFEAGYWRFRDRYDRGMPELDYWRAVTGAADLGRAASDALTAADVEFWDTVDPESVELLAELGRDGRNLALLSNAPVAHGAAFRTRAWAAPIREFLISGELGVAKPDAAMWRTLGERLHAEPAGILFFDDKPANVDAAAAAGIQAVLWTTPAEARVRVKEFLAG